MNSEFERNVVDIWGEKGKSWLGCLPTLLEDLSQNWEFQERRAFSNLTYSYVTRVDYKGFPAVLKITFPCERASREIAWYTFQASRGCPELLRADEKQGAMLLEEISPATTCKLLVTEGKDDDATKAIVQALIGLKHRPCTNKKFPHVRDFLTSLEKLQGRVEETLLLEAIKLLDKLTSDSSKDVLLHGDLHHDNVLRSSDNWIAIDPHGYIGPRCFEVGAMMCNPYDCFPSDIPLSEIVCNRVERLSELLPFSKYEIQTWSIIYTLISSSWNLEDRGEIPKMQLQIASSLHQDLNQMKGI